MTLWLKGCNTGKVSKSFPNWNCPRPTNPLQKHNNLETWTLSILQSTLLLIICLLFSLRPNIFDCLHWTCFEIEKKSLSFSKFYRSSTVGSSAKFPTCPTFPTTLTHKKQKCLNANFFFSLWALTLTIWVGNVREIFIHISKCFPGAENALYQIKWQMGLSSHVTRYAFLCLFFCAL